jgi:hypothetical protein
MADNTNLLTLLKWSIAQTDGTSPSSQSKLSDEDRAFLEKVFNENVKDEPKRLREILTKISKFIDDSMLAQNEDEIIEMLEEVSDIICQIDMAQVFMKFGGLECVLLLLESADLSTKARCVVASIIGEMSQNNSVVQQEIHDKGIVGRLAQVMAGTSSDIGNKILFSISCAIRNHSEAESHFVANYSQSVFSTALNDTDSQLFRRALFLANALISSDHTSVERINRILPLFIPSCLNNLEQCKFESRLSIFQFLAGVFRVDYAWNICQQHRDFILNSFNNRCSRLRESMQPSSSANNDEDMCKDELAAIEEACAYFNNPQFLSVLTNESSSITP